VPRSMGIFQLIAFLSIDFAGSTMTSRVTNLLRYLRLILSSSRVCTQRICPENSHQEQRLSQVKFKLGGKAVSPAVR
jgi:hypothetical protein